MRLGGAISGWTSPEEWVEAMRGEAYSAAFCPVGLDADEDTVRAYALAAREADIIIAEVGAWGHSPLSPDPEVARAGLEGCCRALELADSIGAVCAVNVAGSRGEKWDGPHPDDLTEDTFALIVDTVRTIIDTVKPLRACYALETMPWMYPNSPASYQGLVKAIDRRRFAVHLDPVNLVCSPQCYYDTRGLLAECFRLLGPHIVGCHAKDILLQPKLMVHLDEARPGLGNLDYRAYVRGLGGLHPDVPLMIEHLSRIEDYRIAAAYIRNIAQIEGVPLK